MTAAPRLRVLSIAILVPPKEFDTDWTRDPSRAVPGRYITFFVTQPETGTLHHVELWVPDLPRAVAEWGWLLGRLGYEQFQDWQHGRSWRLAGTYLVVEQSPALSGAEHDRLRPGLNHLAFHAGSRQAVDAITADAPAHGWTLLFPDRHPHAGGPDHYAAYLASTDGFEAELVAAGT
jgi:catechol 2,3-dioxygenase-like lactoylglutathione lyase family enzyme